MFTKNYKKALRREIIERIDFEGYEITAESDDEKILALVNVARDEVGYEFARKGMQGGLEYWLSGLPTCISLPVYHGEVIEFAEKIGSVVNPTDKEAEKITLNFYRFMANNILQMHTAAIRRRSKSL